MKIKVPKGTVREYLGLEVVQTDRGKPIEYEVL